MSRLINEINPNTSNKIKYYLAKVESIDEDYIITFSIPTVLENLSKYPTAYPKNTDHIKEVKEGDSVIIEQLDTTTQFFMYYPVNKNNNTGMYFGDVKVDITDGKTINIISKSANVVIDGEKDNINITTNSGDKIELNGQDGSIFIGDKNYSLNQWIDDLDTALSSLTTEGTPFTHSALKWYANSIVVPMQRIKQIFKTGVLK